MPYCFRKIARTKRNNEIKNYFTNIDDDYKAEVMEIILNTFIFSNLVFFYIFFSQLRMINLKFSHNIEKFYVKNYK